jgi:hypothetical protein
MFNTFRMQQPHNKARENQERREIQNRIAQRNLSEFAQGDADGISAYFFM